MEENRDHKGCINDLLLICYVNYFEFFKSRPHHLVDFLKNHIKELTVIYPIGDLTKLNRSQKIIHLLFKWEYQKLENVNFLGVYTVGPGRKCITYVSIVIFFIKALIFLRFKRINLTIAETPWGGVIALWLRKLGITKKVLYEDLDFFMDFFSGEKERKITYDLEEKVIQNSDQVLSVGILLAELRKRQGTTKVEVVPNGVNKELFFTDQDEKKQYDFIYIGSLEPWAGLEITIHALSGLETNFNLIIIGDGKKEYVDSLVELTKVKGMQDRVLFTGRVPYSEIPVYLGRAKVGLACFKPSDLMKYAATLKVLEYAAAGLPIIATDIGETAIIIDRYQIGLKTQFNSSQISWAMEKLMFDSNLYKTLSNNCLKCAEEYDWDKLLERELYHIQTMVGIDNVKGFNANAG